MTRKHRKLLTYLSRYYRSWKANPTASEAAHRVGVPQERIRDMVQYLIDDGELIRRADGVLRVVADLAPVADPVSRPRAGDNFRTAPDAQHLVAPILSLFAQRSGDVAS